MRFFGRPRAARSRRPRRRRLVVGVAAGSAPAAAPRPRRARGRSARSSASRSCDSSRMRCASRALALEALQQRLLVARPRAPQQALAPVLTFGHLLDERDHGLGAAPVLGERLRGHLGDGGEGLGFAHGSLGQPLRLRSVRACGERLPCTVVFVAGFLAALELCSRCPRAVAMTQGVRGAALLPLLCRAWCRGRERCMRRRCRTRAFRRACAWAHCCERIGLHP